MFSSDRSPFKQSSLKFSDKSAIQRESQNYSANPVARILFANKLRQTINIIHLIVTTVLYILPDISDYINNLQNHKFQITRKGTSSILVASP
jgi:hypothetical protein